MKLRCQKHHMVKALTKLQNIGESQKKKSRNKKPSKLLSLRFYKSRDFEIGSCRQHGFFILLQ